MSDITDRLKELAHAAADQNWGEFSMRVPADHARDADLVLLAASKEITSLRAELERERMRLAACGVVAMANTPESAARARDIHPDYRSASCDDVARAVDSEMSLRAELAELRKPDCFRCAYWFACRTLIKDDCGGGDKFVPKRDPVRLYEKEGAA